MHSNNQSATGSQPLYYLHRNYRSSIRLNTQHTIYRRALSTLIYPTIKLPPAARIADVATGTGAWLLDVARESPDNYRLDGFDISLAQFPHPKWCPSNVHAYQWNVYESPQADFKRVYDLIHINAIAPGMKDDDARPVLENLKAMAKPGGYIQWTELDVWSAHVAKASDDIDATSSEQLLERFKSVLTARAGSFPGWVSRMPDTFRACGLQDVVSEEYELRSEDLPNHYDNVLLACEEVSSFQPDSDEFRALIRKASDEFDASKRGIAITGTSVIVVGKVA